LLKHELLVEHMLRLALARNIRTVLANGFGAVLGLLSMYTHGDSPVRLAHGVANLKVGQHSDGSDGSSNKLLSIVTYETLAVSNDIFQITKEPNESGSSNCWPFLLALKPSRGAPRVNGRPKQRI
jgi:hypothetical protein